MTRMQAFMNSISESSFKYNLVVPSDVPLITSMSQVFGDSHSTFNSCGEESIAKQYSVKYSGEGTERLSVSAHSYFQDFCAVFLLANIFFVCRFLLFLTAL